MKNSTRRGSKGKGRGKEARWVRRASSFLLAMGICMAACQPVPYDAPKGLTFAPSTAYALDAALDITSYGPVNDIPEGETGSGETGSGNAGTGEASSGESGSSEAGAGNADTSGAGSADASGTGNAGAETGSTGISSADNAESGSSAADASGTGGTNASDASGAEASATSNADADLGSAETISPNTAAENAARDGNAGTDGLANADSGNIDTGTGASGVSSGTNPGEASDTSSGEVLNTSSSEASATGSGVSSDTSSNTGSGGSSGTVSGNSQVAAESGTASANLATLTRDAQTQDIGGLVNSEYAIIYDLDENRIVAEKNADAVIYPASMTKIMTILVCAEHVTDLEEKITITQDILDYIYAQDASNCGFSAGEQIAMRDLLYGIVLPSGADAVLSACRRVAGSDEAFVAMMNQKAQELGLSANAHFANASGLFAADHHVTAKDMAQVLNAAMQNPIARQVLTTASYQTAPTNVRSKGYSFSNLFLQRQASQDTGGTQVQAAKTGYISQARSCAASYGTSQSGKHYIVVTGKASSAWQCVYDHAALYRVFS